MTTNDDDDRIVDNLTAQQRYELTVIERDIQEMKLRDRENRRTWIGYALAGAAVFSLVLTLILGILIDVHHGDATHQHMGQQCIDAGNIWYDNNCLVSHK